MSLEFRTREQHRVIITPIEKSNIIAGISEDFAHQVDEFIQQYRPALEGTGKAVIPVSSDLFGFTARICTLISEDPGSSIDGEIISMTAYLTPEQVFFLHSHLVSETGGEHGVRDLGMLLSALGNTSSHFLRTKISTRISFRKQQVR